MPRMLNVLIVEDDPNDMVAIKRACAASTVKHSLFSATSAKEGLEMLNNNVVPSNRRLIFLDRAMPEMTGTEFLKQMRKDPLLAPTPVIILTANTDEEGRRELHQMAISGYFQKPYEHEKLVKLVDVALHYWDAVQLP